MITASEQNVDFLVLETGLGGRLDATRCAPADLAILTSISKEHTDILGGDLNQIIREKAAIARPGKPIIARVMSTNNYQKTVESVARNCYQVLIDEKNQPAKCHFIDIPDGTTARKEAHILAEQALGVLSQKSMLEDVDELLNWPGRMQRISLPSGHNLILEAAHNPTGLEKIVPELKGNPKSLTKKTSRYPNKPRVEGSNSLNINNKMATDNIFAITNFLNVGEGFFLKK